MKRIIVVLLILFCGASGAGAQEIARNGSGIITGGNSISAPYTVSPKSNFLVVGIRNSWPHTDLPTPQVASVTFGGQPMLQLVNAGDAGFVFGLWYLFNPPPGTGTLAFEVPGGNDVTVVAAADYGGVSNVIINGTQTRGPGIYPFPDFVSVENPASSAVLVDDEYASAGNNWTISLFSPPTNDPTVASWQVGAYKMTKVVADTTNALQLWDTNGPVGTVGFNNFGWTYAPGPFASTISMSLVAQSAVPIADWRVTPPAPAPVSDLSGHGHDGTNMVLVPAVGPLAAPFATRSVNAWIGDSARANGSEVIYEEGGATNGFEISYSAGTIHFDTCQNSKRITVTSLAFPSFIPPGTLVTAVYDHGAMSLYVNGALQATGTNGTSILGRGSPATIGGGGGGDCIGGTAFRGAIEEVVVYDRALTASEINLFAGHF